MLNTKVKVWRILNTFIRDTRYDANHVHFVSRGATRLGFIYFSVLFYRVFFKSFNTFNLY